MSKQAVKSHERIVESPMGEIYVKHWEVAEKRGVPIIMLHDSIGCVALWRDFPAELANATGRDVIAYDRPGYGRSAVCSDTPSFDFIAQEAQGAFPVVAETMGAKRYALYGYSVGGEMAIEIAAAYPDQCEALVTVSAQSFVEQQTLDGVRAAKQHYADPKQFERLHRYHGERTEWALAAWIDIWLDPAFADWNVDKALSKLQCPLLALHGAEDEFGTEAFPRRIVENAAQEARMLLLPDVGHVPHREAPETVLKEVAGFLAQAKFENNPS